MCRNGQEMGSHELSFERSVGTLTVKMGHCCVCSWSGDPSEVAVVMGGYLLSSNFIASLSMRISAAFKTYFWVFQQVSFSLIVLYLICHSVTHSGLFLNFFAVWLISEKGKGDFWRGYVDHLDQRLPVAELSTAVWIYCILVVVIAMVTLKEQ